MIIDGEETTIWRTLAENERPLVKFVDALESKINPVSNRFKSGNPPKS